MDHKKDMNHCIIQAQTAMSMEVQQNDLLSGRWGKKWQVTYQHP